MSGWTEQDSIDLDVEAVLTGARMALRGEARDEAIRRLAARGWSAERIAERLMCPRKSVSDRAGKIGVKFTKPRAVLSSKEYAAIMSVRPMTLRQRKPRLAERSGPTWTGN